MEQKTLSTLFEAIDAGNLSAAQSLLESGENMNAPNDLGQTPLIYSVNCRKIEFVRLFLKAGADVEARDAQGFTALMRTVLTEAYEIRGLLLAYGAFAQATPYVNSKEDIRAWLDAYSNVSGHKAFWLKNGEMLEGYYYVDEDEDIINFTWAFSPFGDANAIYEEILIPFDEIVIWSLYW